MPSIPKADEARAGEFWQSLNSFFSRVTFLPVWRLSSMSLWALPAGLTSGPGVLYQMRQQLEAFWAGVATPQIPELRFAIQSAVASSLNLLELFLNLPLDSEMRAGGEELRNKLQAFYYFQHVDSILEITAGTQRSLEQMVAAASRLDPFLSVWATEGVGHSLTNTRLTEGLPAGFLAGDNDISVRARMVPLHSGMALALAEFFLKQAGTSSLEHALEQFIHSCRQNSGPGYVGAAWEGLGFISRNLYPRLLPSVDVYLSQHHPEILSYFWHGVGRAIYFSPLNLIPSAEGSSIGLRMATNEAPHGLGQKNAVAGFAWALTMVNIRHPMIAVALLERHYQSLPELDAFIHGVQSALIAWCDSASSADLASAFCRHQVESSDAEFLRLWEDRIGKPGGHIALRYKRMKDAQEMEHLFRC